MASQPVDSMAPLASFAKNGYYMVGDAVFRNKLYAIQQASRLRLGVQGVKYIFNDSVFNAQDWKTPVPISLWELYRMRAQQLRDRYDYLVLSFSGGGDSTNVLDSFVLNNILLDEVIVGWPRSQTAGKYVPSTSSNDTNYLSEWDYLIEPKLKWLQTVSPRTKITIVDPYDNMRSAEPDEDIVTVTAYCNYIGYQRYRAIDKELLARQQVYKKCAIIMGIGPPNLAVVGHHVISYFTDTGTAMHASDITAQGLERNVEYFYCSPDMPEITIAQSHALLKAINNKPGLVNLLAVWDMAEANSGRPGWIRRSTEATRRWIKSVLYPSYDHTCLQVDKTTSYITKPGWFSWFYENAHAQEIMQPHWSAVRSVTNTIDPCFLVDYGGGHGADHYVPFRSKFYYIGDLAYVEKL